jgi:alpha-glucosidase
MKPPITLLAAALLAALPVAHAQTVASPDNNIQVNVSVASGRLTYSVAYKGTTVIEASPLGVTVNSTDLGQGVSVGSTTTYNANTAYAWRGTHATAVNNYNGRRYPVTHTGSGTTYTFDVRAFNDGVAFSYLVNGSGSRTINGESTAFTLPAGSTIWYQSNFGHYEGLYTEADIGAVATGTNIGPPPTIRLPNSLGYVAISEGNLVNYSGMHLQVSAARRLKAVLANSSFALSGAIQTPWRVIMIGDLDRLVNNDIIHNVTAAPSSTLFPQGFATSWVRPGRCVWSWLNGYNVSYENMRTYTRLAGSLGFEYNLVDDGWQNWSDPWGQIQQLVTYGNGFNVKIWVWKRWSEISDQTARRNFFNSCRSAGVVGVKIDFMDSESKSIVDFIHNTLRDAAEYQLMVNFHGAGKPTGETRTYPNEMTREAVRGKEYGSAGPTHTAIVLLTRALAGHLDFTPMDLDSSVSREIASAICMTSALLVYAEDPQKILNSPFLDLIKNISPVWDETRVLPQTQLGRTASFARRKGTRWFVGTVNGSTAVGSFNLALSFLSPGKTYNARIIRDGATAYETRTVTSTTTLTGSLAANGGFVAEFTEAAASTALQAESAVLSGGTVSESTNAGYNGTGYANSPTAGGVIEFRNVDGKGGGTKTLRIRFALGATASRSGVLRVNGTAQTITFATTGSWTSWANTTATLSLTSGATNTIRLESNGSDLANIDEIEVQ